LLLPPCAPKLTTSGCYFSLGDIAKCQELLDAIPGLIDKKKVGGKDLPTEVFIKKKCTVSCSTFWDSCLHFRQQWRSTKTSRSDEVVILTSTPSQSG
jgi:hypothetical protein